MGLTPQRAMDAVLRRVAAHPLHERLVVRGGLVSRAWVGPSRRPVEDVDLLAELPLTPAELPDIFAGIAAVRVDDDMGVEAGESRVIWAESPHPGLRATLVVKHEADEVPVQVDIGFGDPMDPAPGWQDIGFEQRAHLRAIRPETGIAWKAHGLFEHEHGRWRAKDLHDLDLFLTWAPVDPDALRRALTLAFASRNAPLSLLDRLFEGELGRSGRSLAGWEELRAARPGMPFDTLAVTADRVTARLRPVVEAALGPIPEMHGGFPELPGLGGVWAAVGGLPGVVVHQRADHRVLCVERPLHGPGPGEARWPRTRYHRALLRECRGLVYTPDGRPLARPYHTFFRVDNHPSTRLPLLAPRVASSPPLALEKLDGAMVTAVLLAGSVRLLTRRGTSPLAADAETFAAGRPAVEPFCRRWIERGWTPIFEWCARAHRIVVDHPEPRLVLTALRHIRTGRYLPYDEMRADADGVEVVPSRGRVSDLAALVASVRAEPEGEGVVLRFDDGQMVKVKTDRYQRLHRAVEASEPTRARWEVLLHGEAARLVPLLPPEEAAELEALRVRIDAALRREAARIAEVLPAWEAARALPRKERSPVWEALLDGLPNPSALCLRMSTPGDTPEALVSQMARSMAAGAGAAALRRWLA